MDHEGFTKTVARAADLDPATAERAIEATLVTLGERISEGEARDLARHLPDSLARMLVRPGEAEGFGADEFFRRVAEREGTDPETAERHARAVVAALARREGRKELHDMLSQLPRELRDRLTAPVQDPVGDQRAAQPRASEQPAAADPGTAADGAERAPTLLVVLSGADSWTLRGGRPHPTGFWAEELVTPMQVFRDAGVAVTLATPGGVPPTVDEGSLTAAGAGTQELADELRAALALLADELASPVALEDVEAMEFDGVFIPGGHGPMEDLAVSEALGRLLVAMLEADRVVASVCHGPAGLLSAMRDDGTWAFAGRDIAAFTNDEEMQAGLADEAPWLLEDRLREAGAVMHSGAAPWEPFSVVDGNLVTGQNPASSGEVARRTAERLAARPAGAQAAPDSARR
jgi:putative intracellular protease/amidase/uncharacterized protein (DUF2267 family)